MQELDGDMTMNVTQQRMTMIFNEWAKRYSENKDAFGDMFNEKGEIIQDYGEKCTLYFEKIAKELDEKNLLPVPPL